MFRQVRFKLLIPILLSFSVAAYGQTDSTQADTVVQKPYPYEPKSIWPTIIHGQYAGFIGQYCIGLGYHFFDHNRLNVSVMYGYVPPEFSTREIHTAAFKATWRLLEYKNLMRFKPSLFTGGTLNYEFSNHAFLVVPSHFEDDYYSPQAIHFTFFLGARAHILIDEHHSRAIEPYLEYGTLDNYLWYFLKNKHVEAHHIFKFAVGLSYYFN